MQVQVGLSENFTGIIDVLTRKMATFGGDLGTEVIWSEVPDEYTERVEQCIQQNCRSSMRC